MLLDCYNAIFFSINCVHIQLSRWVTTLQTSSEITWLFMGEKRTTMRRTGVSADTHTSIIWEVTPGLERSPMKQLRRRWNCLVMWQTSSMTTCCLCTEDILEWCLTCFVHTVFRIFVKISKTIAEDSEIENLVSLVFWWDALGQTMGARAEKIWNLLMDRFVLPWRTVFHAQHTAGKAMSDVHFRGRFTLSREGLCIFIHFSPPSLYPYLIAGHADGSSTVHVNTASKRNEKQLLRSRPSRATLVSSVEKVLTVKFLKIVL